MREKELKHAKSLKEQLDAQKGPSLKVAGNYMGTVGMGIGKLGDREQAQETEYFRKQTNEKIKNLKHK